MEVQIVNVSTNYRCKTGCTLVHHYSVFGCTFIVEILFVSCSRPQGGLWWMSKDCFWAWLLNKYSLNEKADIDSAEFYRCKELFIEMYYNLLEWVELVIRWYFISETQREAIGRKIVRPKTLAVIKGEILGGNSCNFWITGCTITHSLHGKNRFEWAYQIRTWSHYQRTH